MTSPQLPAALAAAVLVIVDGTLVPTAPPATLRDGRVVASAQLVARFADRVALDRDVLTATRTGRTCTARTVASDPPTVAVAPLARCLGASRVTFDARTKTLALTFAGAVTIVRTPAPFDPAAPQVSPTTIFTPEPAPPTPRVIVTGSPRPRRTPIPVYATPATSPRPRSP